MKKLINSVETVLTESLEGFGGGACRHPDARAPSTASCAAGS